MTGLDLGTAVEDQRLNAALGWSLVGFLCAVAVETLLDGALLWAGFSLVAGALALVPTAVHRDPRVMLPWEVLLLATLPVLGNAFATTALSHRIATYVSVAAVAVIVAVELHVFTSVRMNHAFAVTFVVVATLAAAGVWAVVQWLSDASLGTSMLQSNEQVMWGFVWAAVAGIGGGVLFDRYFQRRARAAPRLPDRIGGEER